MNRHISLLGLLLLPSLIGCGGRHSGNTVTMSASRVGPEAEILRTQVARFLKANPDIHVTFQDTPDASDQRHQLYAQYLNARTGDPDILQLDVVWTPEFAGAGWVMALDEYFPAREKSDFFPATIQANEWQGKLYGLPWFVDVGMLYYRKDLVSAPESFTALTTQAEHGKATGKVEYGLLWQGQRYEGLVCVFMEYLGGFGGQIMDDKGQIAVDSDQAIQALTYMRDSIYVTGVVPQDTLQWQEEQTRLQFQNGHSAFLRNWPYCARLMNDSKVSKVADKFAVTVMPKADDGRHTATLGGSQLAINAFTDQADASFKLISYLTQPEQMLERAQKTGQFPSRRSLYDNPDLEKALPIPAATVRELIDSARPRPVTPVYTELSEILQIWLHRALVRETEPRPALEGAARQMRELLIRYDLAP